MEGDVEGFHDGQVLHIGSGVFPFGGRRGRIPQEGVEDEAVREEETSEAGGGVVAGKGGIGQDIVVRALAGSIGVGIAVLVGGVGGVVKPGGEYG